MLAIWVKGRLGGFAVFLSLPVKLKTLPRGAGRSDRLRAWWDISTVRLHSPQSVHKTSVVCRFDHVRAHEHFRRSCRSSSVCRHDRWRGKATVLDQLFRQRFFVHTFPWSRRPRSARWSWVWPSRWLRAPRFLPQCRWQSRGSRRALSDGPRVNWPGTPSVLISFVFGRWSRKLRHRTALALPHPAKCGSLSRVLWWSWCPPAPPVGGKRRLGQPAGWFDSVPRRFAVGVE